MTQTSIANSPILGYYEDDKPITLEAFESLFLEVRQLRRANKALARKLEKLENGYED
jgi:hypothetical protein